MCEYCTLKLTQGGKIKSGTFLYASKTMSVSIHADNRESIFLNLDMFVENDNEDVRIKISYCPICGDYVGTKPIENVFERIENIDGCTDIELMQMVEQCDYLCADSPLSHNIAWRELRHRRGKE